MKKNIRIEIPGKSRDLFDLALAVEEQHTALGKDSPLGQLDWKTASPQIEEADQVEKDIDKVSRQLEKLIERRNNLTPGVAGFVRSCRDVLSSVHRGETRKLVDYGYDVADTPRVKKAAKKAA